MRKLLIFFVFSFCLFLGVNSTIVAEKLNSPAQSTSSATDFPFIAIQVNPITMKLKQNNTLSWRDKVLAWAVENKHSTLVALLLKVGADVNIRNKDGLTILMYAALYGYHEIVHILLAAGADVNRQDKNGETALMSAAFFGRNKIISLLLAAGADINMQDKDGHTALWHANAPVFGNNDEAVHLLLEAGAKK